MQSPRISTLGKDATYRANRLNGVSYQEDALTTFNNWQYAIYYSNIILPFPAANVVENESDNGSVTAAAAAAAHQAESAEPPLRPLPLYIHLARRPLTTDRGEQALQQTPWETLVFDDYAQTTDDGHNTAQLGICRGDGSVHLSFDHHCDRLRYRYSVAGLALRPEEHEWKASQFSATLDALPGLSPTLKTFHDVSYPRFRSVDDDLLFTHRLGRAGLGSDVLYSYTALTRRYTFTGQHLTGVHTNPYINGLDYRLGRLHLTWTYRGFVWYLGWDDPSDTKHKAQAGPNGAENNYDLCYAYSDDLGRTWRNGAGGVVAGLENGEGGEGVEGVESIMPDSEGIVAFSIPKNSGLTNQEAQAVDGDGGVHVLNRDRIGGVLQWKHYYRSPSGQWSATVIPGFDQASIGKRGSIAIGKDNNLYLALPDSSSQSLRVLKATSSSGYKMFVQGYEFQGCDAEPLIDKARLEEDGGLSILTTRISETAANGIERDVVVVDLEVW